jgi:dynein heavy chain
MEGGGGDGGDGGVDEEGIVMSIADGVLRRIPPLLDIRRGHKDTVAEVDGMMNSMGVFLLQEVARFNNLVKVVVKSLNTLKMAVKGLVVMSAELEKMYQCFLFQQVPVVWENVAYPSLKPLNAWIDDFFNRLECSKEWLENGPPNSYWLSGFFFPQGFMTAVLQTFSRATSTAIDTLTFETHVQTSYLEDISEAPTLGVFVHGLFMQGARFDLETEKMEESRKAQLFFSMPVIQLNPLTMTEKMDRMDTRLTYRCPLYKTSLRAGTLSTTGHSTNFVVPMDIPSDQPQAHWIRRGVALLCMLDD